MRALLPIPAPLVPTLLESLLTIYGTKAEQVHQAVGDDAAEDRLEHIRGHRLELLDVDELLDQLDLSPARRDVEIAGEREVLAIAVYDAVCDATETLGGRCNDYWNGRASLSHIACDLAQVYGLLRLLHAIEIEATAPTEETIA